MVLCRTYQRMDYLVSESWVGYAKIKAELKRGFCQFSEYGSVYLVARVAVCKTVTLETPLVRLQPGPPKVGKPNKLPRCIFKL